MGNRLRFVWCSMGLSKNCKGGIIELKGPFCREKKENDLEIHLVVHFLDGLEEEE